MRKVFILLAAAFATSASFAQNDPKVQGQSSFFAEGGGAGIMFSANIDHRFAKSSLGFGGRIGVGFVTAYDPYDSSGGYYYYYDNQSSAVSIPFQLNYIFGKESSPHTFEVGAGITYVGKKLDIMNFYEDKASKVFATFSFMYRRQPRNGGFSWRAGFTPLLAKGYIQPFGGLGLGYNF